MLCPQFNINYHYFISALYLFQELIFIKIQINRLIYMQENTNKIILYIKCIILYTKALFLFFDFYRRIIVIVYIYFSDSLGKFEST